MKCSWQKSSCYDSSNNINKSKDCIFVVRFDYRARSLHQSPNQPCASKESETNYTKPKLRRQQLKQKHLLYLPSSFASFILLLSYVSTFTYAFSLTASTAYCLKRTAVIIQGKIRKLQRSWNVASMTSYLNSSTNRIPYGPVSSRCIVCYMQKREKQQEDYENDFYEDNENEYEDEEDDDDENIQSYGNNDAMEIRISQTKQMRNIPNQAQELSPVYESIQAMQIQILSQQQQIHNILDVLKHQQKQQTNDKQLKETDIVVNQDNAPNQQQSSFSFFDHNTDYVFSALNDDTSLVQNQPFRFLPKPDDSMTSIKKIPVYVFVDGTWLYYSIHERDEVDCPIIARYGRGWQMQYTVDWKQLPSIIEDALTRQLKFSDSDDVLDKDNLLVEYKVVNTAVYTSYKADTSKTSFRYQMYQDMIELGVNSTFRVYMMETIGKSEKCVDIQLAVDMVHLASSLKSERSHDDDDDDDVDRIVSKEVCAPVAVLLTGDKDFIPAMVRTRQAGMKLALCSMKRGCNRALRITPNLKDFDHVIWIEDYLDRLIQEKYSDSVVTVDTRGPSSTIGKTDQTFVVQKGRKDQSENNVYEPPVDSATQRNVQLSTYTVTKVINDFIVTSRQDRVSSRDMGRYLKSVVVPTVGSILQEIKRSHGGLRQFLSVSGAIYQLIDDPYKEDETDHSYWVALRNSGSHPDEYLIRYLQGTVLSQAEKVFFERFYSVEPLRRNYALAYQRTLSQQRRSQHNLQLLQHPYQPQLVSSSQTSRRNSLNSDTDEEDMRANGTNQHNKDARTIGYKDDEDATLETQTDTLPSYEKYTVAHLKEICRQKGLIVSGRKEDLIQRITKQDQLDRITPATRTTQDCSTASVQNTALDRPVVDDERDPELNQYLQSLILEYVQAKGGRASTRNVGRYLAANRPFRPRNGIQTALQELKLSYGSVSTYLSLITKNERTSKFVQTRTKGMGDHSSFYHTESDSFASNDSIAPNTGDSLNPTKSKNRNTNDNDYGISFGIGLKS